MAGVSGKKGRNISKQNVTQSNFPGTGFKSIRALHAAQAGDEFIDVTALVPPSVAVANGYTPPSVSDLQKVSLLQFKQNVTLKTDSIPLLQDVQYVITGARTIRLSALAGPGQIYELTINAEPRTGTTLTDARPLSVTGVLLSGQVDFNVGSPFKVGEYPNSQIGAVCVYADGVLLKRNPGNQPGGTGDYYEVHAGAGLGVIVRFNSSIGSDRDVCVISVGSLVERPDGSQDALIDSLAGQIDVIRDEVESQHGITIPIGAPNNVDLKAFGDRVLLLEQSGGSSLTIEDEGVGLPPSPFLNFVGAGVVASDLGGKTTITIPGGAGSAYDTVEDEGVALTQRTTMDFQGVGVTVTDDGSQTVVTIPGGTAAPVDSVNGATGVIVLDTDDIAEGAANNYSNTVGGQSDITGNTDVAANTTHRGLVVGNPHAVTSTEVGLSNVTNDAQIPLIQKGAANGVAELDASSRIPSAQLPTSTMEYQGAWNANSNTPVLADGVGDVGDLYRISVSGTQNLGSGNIAFSLGDAIIYNGSIWERIPADDLVVSVNGQLGVVVLDPDDLDDTSTTNKFTTSGEASKLAGIETGATSDQTDGEIETAYNNQVGIVSQVDAEAGASTTVERWTAERVGQAITAQSGNLSNVVEDITPQLGGNLDAQGFNVTGVGTLGIGTSAPNAPLEVIGSGTCISRSHADTPTSNSVVGNLCISAQSSVDMSDGFGPLIAFEVGDNTQAIQEIAQIGAIRDGSDDSGALVFRPLVAGTPVEQMRIESAGNVGIGDQNPSNVLSVIGGSPTSLARNLAGGLGIASALDLKYITSSGVPTVGDGVQIGLQLENTAGSVMDYAYIRGIISDPTLGAEDADFIIGTMVAGSVVERMRMTPGGDILIGDGLNTSRLQVRNDSQTSYFTGGLESRSFSGDVHIGLHASGASAASIRHLRGGNGVEILDSSNVSADLSCRNILANGTAGIGTVSPAPSSVLDVTSTTQGALVPRMTTTQRNAISSPATSLLIFNLTSTQHEFYNGSAWLGVGLGAGGSSYDTMEDEGTPLIQRNVIDFQGAGVTASDDGGQTVVTIPGTEVAPGVKVTHSGSQTVPNLTVVSLAFDTETYDTDNIHSTVTNNSRLTANTAGVYIVVGNSGAWSTAFNATVNTFIRKNGVEVVNSSSIQFSTEDSPIHVSSLVQLAVNDYVELQVSHNQGGSLSITGTSSNLSMQKISD